MRLSWTVSHGEIGAERLGERAGIDAFGGGRGPGLGDQAGGEFERGLFLEGAELGDETVGGGEVALEESKIEEGAFVALERGAVADIVGGEIGEEVFLQSSGEGGEGGFVLQHDGRGFRQGVGVARKVVGFFDDLLGGSGGVER